MRTYRVGTFVHPVGEGTFYVMAYLRDYSSAWDGCIEYEVEASSGLSAKNKARDRRRANELAKHLPLDDEQPTGGAA